ncbi:uncharacterized protein FFNC_15603 [Fusarium fujikuroi]|nr:uncharacterized protein FFNC_15603 [Fusarium fujikuroi]
MPCRFERHCSSNATADREITDCHACNAEYDQDENGPVCPECHGKVRETIDLGNDSLLSDQSPSISVSSDHHADDSDPEEGDIDELAHPDSASNNSVRHSHHDHQQNPGSELARILFMLRTPPLPVAGRNRASLWSPRVRERDREPHIVRRTSLPGLFGSIATPTPISFSFMQATRSSPSSAPGREFARGLLENLSRHIGQPSPTHEYGNGEDVSGFLDPNILMVNHFWRHFDMPVWIFIENMQVNPSSGAAPPATEGALKSLERKLVDTNMLNLQGRLDCTICIDEMEEGAVIIRLPPCQHYFHADCVIRWLKEHSTCPICRKSIERTVYGDNDSSESHGRNHNADGDQAAGPNLEPSSEQHR